MTEQELYYDHHSTRDAREAELGERVVDAEVTENLMDRPGVRTFSSRELSERAISTDAAVAQAIARNREYERAHPEVRTLDELLREASGQEKEPGE
jgi:hypothetical protein